MTSIGNGWLRRSLLICLYALGVFGILASGDGSDDDFRAFTCGLSVRGIAPVGDGTVWIGVFAKTNTNTEDRVVLLGIDGSELFSSDPIGNGGSENAVRVVARATDGSNDVYIGGDFSGGILRLDDNGSPDDIGFNNQVVAGFNGRVTSIAPQADGDVYVGGYFTEYNGNTISGLVRLNVDGSWDNMEFITAGVTNVESVALATDAPLVGYVYSGGSGAIPLGRWESDGDPDATFISALDPVFSVIPAADATGDIYVGGSFANSINRLTNIGTSEPGFNANVGTGFDNDVLSIDRAVTGGIYVGGSFTTYDGDNSNGIARININGTRDGLFMVGSGFTDPDGIFPSSKVVNVAQDVSLDVFVGGGFTQYNGIASNGIVRLDPDGSLDTAFDVSLTIDGEVCDSQTIPD